MEAMSMLCQFTVKNYKSIRDEVTFDMQGASISEHENKVIRDVDGEVLLPVSALYGPNGGGKSNVLKAMQTLVAKVLRPLYASTNSADILMFHKNVNIEPFKFAEETKNAPTEFEIFFRTKFAEYRYRLHVNKEKVIYESLDRIKLSTRRRSGLFERKYNDIELRGDFSKITASNELSENLPFLSYL